MPHPIRCAHGWERCPGNDWRARRLGFGPAARSSTVFCGRRVERLSREVAEAERALAALVAEVAPALLEECGVGPVKRALARHFYRRLRELPTLT